MCWRVVRCAVLRIQRGLLCACKARVSLHWLSLLSCSRQTPVPGAARAAATWSSVSVLQHCTCCATQGRPPVVAGR